MYNPSLANYITVHTVMLALNLGSVGQGEEESLHVPTKSSHDVRIILRVGPVNFIIMTVLENTEFCVFFLVHAQTECTGLSFPPPHRAWVVANC